MDSNLATWRGIKAGDTLSFADAQSIIKQMKENKGVNPIGLEVKEVLIAKEMNNLGEWRFIQLAEGKWLMVKIVDADLSFVLLRDAPDWEPSTRKQLVDKELLFMFNAPANPDKFEYPELTYVDNINVTNSEVNSNEKTKFFIKPQGELHATMNWQPARSGIGQLFATIVEYATEASKALVDSQLVFLEYGTEGGNGVVKLLVGRPVNPVDVSLTPRK